MILSVKPAVTPYTAHNTYIYGSNLSINVTVIVTLDPSNVYRYLEFLYA
jgi:hypothetical protein